MPTKDIESSPCEISIPLTVFKKAPSVTTKNFRFKAAQVQSWNFSPFSAFQTHLIYHL